MTNQVLIMVGGSDLFSGVRGISKGTRIIKKALIGQFDEIVMVNYNYFLDFGSTLKKLKQKIDLENRNDEVFLYGYSKGGEVVLQLSRAISNRIPLLLTIDIANGPWSNKIDRTIPKNVVQNINVYQSRPRFPLYSYGMPTTSDTVVVQNIDLTGHEVRGKDINHSNIEILMVDRVVNWLKYAVA